MTPPAHEASQLHTRLIKCALELDETRAYWSRADGQSTPSPEQAFREYWFGACSLDRVVVLLANFRVRFDAFPPALAVLHRWPDMPFDVRRSIAHWHLQLADPLYRAFTGSFLVDRLAAGTPTVTRDLVVRWVAEHGLSHWLTTTRIQFARKLLFSAHAAGLIDRARDPRASVLPRIPDAALEYLLYLLRGVAFDGTLLANPYLASVGLEGKLLEDRLRRLPGLTFRRQADLVDFGWRYPDLATWAEATLPALADRANQGAA